MFDILQKGYKPPKKNAGELENKDNDIFIQVYMRKSELDQHCNYEGTVTENEISGALFSIRPDAIPSKRDGNVSKKR